MPRPTLYSKGSLVPLNKKVTKDELDNYVPIHYILNVIKYKLSKEVINIHDRLLFLKAETGSGKTTVLPVELYREMFTRDLSKFGSMEEEKLEFRKMLPTDFSIFDYPDDEYTIANRKRGISETAKKTHYIGCTQPKGLTAVEKAKENSDAKDYNPDIDLGVNIGYATGTFKQRFTDEAGMLYMTLGNFGQQLKRSDAANEIKSKYIVEMIDECHERSKELDVSVVLIREMLRANAGDRSMPLFIFMSATFDVDKFADYFGTPRDNAIYVVGETAKKTITYLNEPCINYVTGIADLVMKIHNENPNDPPEESDILIFVHGSPDDREIISAIEKADTKQEFITLKVDSNAYNNDPTIIELLSKTTITEAAERVKRPNAKRRVTVSTNAAETGLTIPTLKYVIDSGWEKSTYYSANQDLPMLLVKPVAQSSSIQRFGRVGRKFYGYAYGMYTEADFKLLEEYKAPDIYTNDLSKQLLEIMYSSLPMGTAHKRLNAKQFKEFANNCLLKCPTSRNCNFLFDSIANNKPYIDESLFAGVTAVESLDRDCPPETLDPIMQDTYIAGRNRIISLGFYGNYVGYIASRVSRLSIESIRMIMASQVYGTSLYDMVNIAVIIEARTGGYLYDWSAAKKSKGRVEQFSMVKLLNEIIDDKVIKKHYFGNVMNFIEIFYDDYIRALAIVRFIVINLKKLGPTKTMAKCDKMGINYRKLMMILETRKGVIDTLNEFGITNNVPEFDFNSHEYTHDNHEHTHNVTDEVCRIKKCIYAGYKNNIGYFKDGSYVTGTGITFSATIYSKRKPSKVIYNRLNVMAKPKTIFYQTTADSICSLEGLI